MPASRLSSKRVRLAAIASVIWFLLVLMFALVLAEHCSSYEGRCSVDTVRFVLIFLSVGVLPLVVAWGIFWVQSASSSPATPPTSSTGEDDPVQASARPAANPVWRTELRCCKVCGKERKTRYSEFNENISYFFARRVRTVSGFMCFPCMSKQFLELELKTLFFTWWGMIGAFIGPVYLLGNIGEYVKNSYHFAADWTST